MGYVKHIHADKYQLTATLGTDINGKKIRKYKNVRASSFEAAKGKMEVFEEECRNTDFTSNGCIRFEDMVDAWKKDYADINLKHSTLEIYDRLLNRNFGVFQGKQLKSIKHRDVQKWINQLHEQGLSTKSLNNNLSLLKSIFKKAVQWEYLSKNPATDISLPKSSSKESKYYNDEEVAQLIDALNNLTGHDITYKVGILIALFGGLRRGELCGLDISDIDFEHCRINIRQTRMLAKGKGIYKDTPKSLKSVRNISIPEIVIKNIEGLLEQQQLEADALGSAWVHSPA